MRHSGCEDAITTTLERFLEVDSNLFAPSGVPYYLFVFVDKTAQPLLASYIHEHLDGLPEKLPAPFQNFRAQAMQFAIGGEGTGSPQHFHDDAFNVLIAGRKRWWLWPPALAAMSRVHPA